MTELKMIDLKTNYLGLPLRTPLVASASPLSQELDGIRHLEDAGASAIVLYSLFEEQLRQDSIELEYHLAEGTDSFAEASSFFPQPNEFHVGPEGYLNHIRRAKEAVAVPVIASLNGSTLGGWANYARQIEQAGADAIECNIYFIPTDAQISGAEIEKTYIDILREVKASVRIPVAVKVSPFFSNLAHMAKQLDQAGANALVLFNRFLSTGYQPGRFGNPTECAAQWSTRPAAASDLDRNSIRPYPRQPGRNQRRARARGRH